MRRAVITLCVGVLCLAGKLATADTRTVAGDLISEELTSFTGLAQTPEANLFSGSLTTPIPIEVPPGRKNLTPKLALVYSSAGGPSPYGYGWDLPIGRIQRSTKWGVPRCTGTHTDDFVLNMPDGTAELVADPAGSTTYRPKVEESYLEADRDTTNNLWVVYDRSGMKYTFGDVASARVSNTTDLCQFTTIWALTRVEDPNGNSMVVNYLSYSNVLYPASIDYGGNLQAGLGAFYHVRFNYSPRPDLIENDLSGVRATLTFTLATIRVTTDFPSSTTIRTYTLAYDAAGNGQNGYRSVLSSVAFTGVDGSLAYPTEVLSCEAGPNGFTASATYTPPAGLSALRVSTPSGITQTLLDMNGDGIVDLVQSGASTWTVYFGSPTGFSTTATTWQLLAGKPMGLIRNTAQAGDYDITNHDTFDINGDGIPDFVDASTSTWQVYLGTPNSINGGWGFGPSSVGQPWPAPSSNTRVDFVADVAPWRIRDSVRDMIDMNGDGLPDIVNVAPNTPSPGVYSWSVYFNNRTGFDLATPLTFTSPYSIRWSRSSGNGSPDYGGVKRDLFDFNGDGLPDIVSNPADDPSGEDERCSPDVFRRAGCFDVYLNTGQGFASCTDLENCVPSVVLPVPPSNYLRAQTATETFQDVFDINGDGLPDWVSFTTNRAETITGWFVLLNLGGTFEPLVFNPWIVTPGYYYGEATRLWERGDGPIRFVTNEPNPRTTTDMIDFNGDGILDRVVANSGPWSVQLSTKWVSGASKTAVRPNLVTSIDNGIGGTTLAFYKPSTLYDNTGGDGAPDLPFITWVTSGTRRLDGQCTPAPSSDYDAFSPDLNLYVPADNNCISSSHELAQSFTYKDGRFDAAAREFRGFRMVYTTDIDPSITRTTFGQEASTQGKVLQGDIYAGSTASAQLVRSTLNSWGVAPFGTARTQVWLASSTVYSYDLNNGTAWSFAATANDRPDAFGNTTHSYRTGSAAFTRLDTFTDYALPMGARRVHDKPSHTYSEYTGPGVADQFFDEKSFYYDGDSKGLPLGTLDKGNVKVVESLLDVGAAHRRAHGPGGGGSAKSGSGAGNAAAASRSRGATNPQVHMTYDTCGNITVVRDALDRPTTTTYDSKCLYPVEVQDALGHITTTQTDYRWGKPVAVTGPNQNEVTEYDYDQAGRLICVARPYDSTPGTLPPTNCSMQYAYTFASGGQFSSVAVRHKEPNQMANYPNQRSGYVTTTEYVDGIGRHQYTAGFRVVNGTDQTVISNRVEYDPVGRVATRYDPYPMSPGSDAAAPAPPNNGVTAFQYLLNGLPISIPSTASTP